MKGLIVSGGAIEDYDFLRELVKQHDYILCADSGLDHMMKISMEPNLVIGDLDSVSPKGLDFIRDKNIETLQYPVKKDKTDTELAIDYMIEIGIENITLTAVVGSRLDHSLMNIYLLKILASRGIEARIINENNIVQYLNKNISIEKKEGYHVSIIPISLDGVIVSLDGFLYPLEEATIEFSSSLGISNEIVDQFATITIHRGEALIMESRD